MSIFKVAGNYYENVLDYFTREYKKIDPTYNRELLQREYKKYTDNPDASKRLRDFKNNFNKIFEIEDSHKAKKTEIIKILAKTFVRLEKIKHSDHTYWNSRVKRYRILFSIFIVMIAVTIGVIGYVVYKFEKDKVDTERHKKSYITIIAGFTLISIFILIILNLRMLTKMSIRRREDNVATFNDMQLLMFSNIKLQDGFVAIGYAMSGDNANYKTTVKRLQNTNKLDTQAGRCSTVDVNIENIVIEADTCSNPSNYERIYDRLKYSIRDFMFHFYNYSYGYLTLNKIIIKTSPMFLLKEVRKLMSFYYYLVNQRGNYNIELKTIEAVRQVIDDGLIKELEALNISYFLENDITNESNEEMIKENEAMPSFRDSLDRFNRGLAYYAVFLYQIYLTNNSMNNTLLLHLPENITDTNDPFLSMTKDFFTNKIDTGRLYDVIAIGNQSKGKGDVSWNNFLSITFPTYAASLSEYIVNLMNDMILNIKGTYIFPLDESYISTKLTGIFTKSPLNIMDSVYQHYFKEAFLKNVLPNVKKTVYASLESSYNPIMTTVQNIVNFKINLVVSKLAETLSNYDINIRQHMPYILDKLTIKRISSTASNEQIEMILDIYKRILERLDNAIEIKKNIKRKDEKIKARFITSAEFTKRLDDYLFDDVQKGLQSDFLYELVNDFYMDVSKSIGGAESIDSIEYAGESNIFYRKMKRLQLAQVLIIEIIIILALVWIYFLIFSFVKNWGDINAVQKDPRYAEEFKKKNVKFAYKVKKLNVSIKIILSFGMVFFVSLMLWSYYRKAKDAYIFNREVIENNTNDLLTALEKLDSYILIIQSITKGKEYVRIGDIPEITMDLKTELYETVLNVIDKYEKCNYIINISQAQLPFPYTEITIDVFMIAVSILAFLYIYNQVNPVAKFQKIKQLQKLKEEAIFRDKNDLKREVEIEDLCNAEDMDVIVFALKIIVFSFIFMFLVFYSVNIIASSDEFRAGLYNSVYYEESICYT